MIDKNLYSIGDILTVKFDDDDVLRTGTVDRDSSGRLFLEFEDGSVAYNDFKIIKF